MLPRVLDDSITTQWKCCFILDLVLSLGWSLMLAPPTPRWPSTSGRVTPSKAREWFLKSLIKMSAVKRVGETSRVFYLPRRILSSSLVMASNFSESEHGAHG